MYCTNCERKTGFKRALGFGTLFAVFITFGLWILAIPFYPKRCTVCNFTSYDAEREMKRQLKEFEKKKG
jgi:hypothetical protein